MRVIRFLEIYEELIEAGFVNDDEVSFFKEEQVGPAQIIEREMYLDSIDMDTDYPSFYFK